MDHVNAGGEPGLDTTDPDADARAEQPSRTARVEDDWDLGDDCDAEASTLSDDDESETLTFLGPAEGPGYLGSLDGYPVECVLGRGAMGIVLKAFDRSLHRPVAIKVLCPILAARPSFRERFLREARAAAAINHSNVVTIHAVGDHRGLPYLVMEYIPGRTLAQRIHARPRLEPIDVVRIGLQIAAGLDAAHKHGLIHRDVKPSNLMLEDSIERVKITDFGLARAAMDQSGLTSLGRIVGTPAYMSPEQVSGAKLDARSDLFALGCVFWAMVTGHSPFRAKNMVGIIRKVQDSSPPPLSQIDPRIPEELSRVVERLLHKSATDRYPSADQVSADLSRLLSRLQMDSGGSPGSVSATDSIERGRPARHTTTRRAVLGGTALVSILVMSFGWVRFGDGPVTRQSLKSAPRLMPTRALLVPNGTRATPVPDGSSRDVGTVPVPKGARILTVGQAAGANFRSISEALVKVGPGMEIHVLDDAKYQERLQIEDPVRLRDLKLISRRQAQLVFPGDGAVVQVKDTPGVRIEGFRIEAGHTQFGVEIMGFCPGLTLDRLVIRSPEKGKWASMWIHRNARGDSARPIVIQDSEFHAVPRGLTVEGEFSSPATAVSIVRNRFFVREGAAVQLLRAVRDIRVTSNIFVGEKSLTMILEVPDASGQILVANNTFVNTKIWLNLTSTTPDVEDVRVDRNLILGGTARASDRALDDFARSWRFEDNHWTRGQDDDGEMLLIAKPLDSVRFVSTDPANLDYLVPRKNCGLDLKPPLVDLSYVGARAPKE